jgi:hypothetical protein
MTQHDRATFASLLSGYLKLTIGINYRDPTKIEAARLVSASQEFFTVSVDGVLYHFPYRAILSCARTQSGSVAVHGAWRSRQYPVVVTVFHLVVYTGSIGFSWEI